MMPTQHNISYETGGETHQLATWTFGDPSNKRVALCVHGLTRNGRDFDYLASTLAETHYVLCPDLPGRGKSDWLSNTQHYNYDTYTQVLLKLLDSVNAENVDWIGTSLGGILGMRIAAEYSNRVNRLVLNDVGAVVTIKGLERINKYVGITMNFNGREEAEAYLQEIFAQFGIRDPQHWQHLLEHSFMPMSNGDYQLAYDPGILDPVRDAARKLKLTADTELWPWWDAIRCPVLIIRGQLSDILTPETAQEMLHRKPSATYVTIRGVGHAPALMEPDQTTLVRDWLLGKTIKSETPYLGEKTA
jgi:pimeloyl-ACP methyl ester carboxylesterase